MSKFKKIEKKPSKAKKGKISEVKFAMRTIYISSGLAGISLVISFLFNGGIITSLMNQNEVLDIIDVGVKVSVILLFFFFMVISIGNLRELLGKPSDWKDLLLLVFLSLIQTIKNPLVFIFTSIGIIILIIYLFVVQ